MLSAAITETLCEQRIATSREALAPLVVLPLPELPSKLPGGNLNIEHDLGPLDAKMSTNDGIVVAPKHAGLPAGSSFSERNGDMGTGLVDTRCNDKIGGAPMLVALLFACWSSTQ